MPDRIFLSYGSKDSETARRILDFLESNGVDCWIAPRDIPPGTDWVEAIIDGIDAASGMVLIVSSAANQSPQVRRELERAVSRGLNLVSILIEPVALSKWMQYYTSTHQRYDASSGELGDHLPRILEALRPSDLRVSADMSNLSSLLEEDIGRLASSIGFEEAESLHLKPGERRRATVLSIRVTPPETGLDSHSMTEKRIAETLGDMVKRVVEAFGGEVETSKAYAYRCVFGLEKALESDSHRAVSSAVRLFNGLGEMNRVLRSRDMVLDFSMAAASGSLEVVSTQPGKTEISGYPLRQADELAESGTNNELLVTESVHRSCGDRFDFRPVETDGARDCYRLVDYSIVPVEGRVLHVRGPLIGRDTDLSRLGRLLERQIGGASRNRRGGARHFVFGLRGEAGIGKSRLVYEFLEQFCAHRDEVLVLRGSTLSYAQPPYWIWTSLIRRQLGIERNGSLDYAELKEHLRGMGEDTELMSSAPFLADLLGIDPGDDPSTELEAEAKALENRVTIRNFVSALARSGKLVIVLDDLHRMDSASRRTLEFVIGNCDTPFPIVFLLVYRSEREDGSSVEFDILPGYAQLEEMMLSPLGDNDSTKLLAHLLAEIDSAESISPEARDRLLSSARGNPLFLEELVLDLVETAGLVVKDGTWVLGGAMDEINIPTTLRSLLQARLDRLPADWRNVLQSTSVLGMEFPLGLYRCFSRRVLSREPETSILDELVSRDLLSCKRSAFQKRYRFGSKLLHGSAYQSILKENLQLMHRAAAESIEEYYPEEDERVPGMLAHHWERAGDAEKAIEWGLKALSNATDAYQNDTAIELTDKLAEWLESRPESRDRTEKLFTVLKDRCWIENNLGHKDLQHEYLSRAMDLVRDTDLNDQIAEIGIMMGRYLEMVGDTDEAEERFRESLDISRREGNEKFEGHCLMALGGIESRRGDSDSAMEYYRRAHRMFERIEDRHNEGSILINMGILNHRLGRIDEALDCYHRGLEIFERMGNRKARAVTLINLGIMHSDQDRMEKALECYRKASGIFRSIGFRRGEAGALVNTGIIQRQMGRTDQALESFEQSLLIEREAGDRANESIALINLGATRMLQQEYGKALECYQRSLEISREMGVRRIEGYSLSCVASAYRELGRSDEALELFEESIRILSDIGEKKALASTTSNLGLLHCATGDIEKALERYLESIRIIKEIGTGRYDSEDTVALYDRLIDLGLAEEEVPWPDHWEPRADS
ncbi:tetratricopeptide repeat protein [Candidatus Fermentibacteria bacterium]|nr:tetratricopeptide repeat protein [Candidatus Fermentibacteria bacterium]